MRLSSSLAIVAVLAATPALAVPAGLSARANALLANEVGAENPGVAAVISDNGKVVWKGAAGRATVDGKTALRPDSLFRYASVSKQFTAALILRLVDEGRLSLDDNLGKLLAAETPAAWHAVTVRQLLNHTSGVPSYTSKPGWMVEANTARAYTTQGLIDVTRDQPLDFAPGTQFRYNNSGYVLLSAIAEKLTGKPWYVALRERITGPLGLTSIRCGCEPGPATVDGFTAGGAASQRIDMSVPSGAGALVGNAGDLAKWAAALHGGRILSPASYRAMITPQLPAGETARYGFGIGLGEVRGEPTIGHNGGIYGFQTETIYLPGRKLFVAVLGNSDSGPVDSGILARRLAAEAIGAPLPVMKAQASDLNALTPYLGIYRDSQGERRFLVRDGKLFTQRAGSGVNEVFAAGGNRYFYGPRSLSYFELSKGPDGTPRMTFYANGALKPDVATWSGPVPKDIALSPAQMDRLAGTYARGPAVMTIARSAAGLTAQLTGQTPFAIEATGPLEFQVPAVKALLTFEEADGKIVRVVLSQAGRTIPFERN
ncbi:hypothetical protein GCM10022281_03470 [Sphingomonas rosea]|uniref:Beta-lactamase-related domain-containing protein n=1 Tax=Sphingomonas rosea TaxID=335605 RepID=A0ABP7TLU1_9SPHN